MGEQRTSTAGPGTARQAFARAAVDVRAIAITATAACTATYLQPEPLPLLLYALLLPICLWRWPGRALLVTALAASAWTSWDIQQHLSSRWPSARSGETITLTGHVAGLVDHDRYRARFVLAQDTPPYRSRLSWYDAAATLRPGDCVSVAAKLDAPHGSANPGAFDYEAWLWRERIDATGYIRRMGHCEQPPRATIDRGRALALARLDHILAGSPMRGIIAALTLGARQDISDAQWHVLRATGTSHLVAISGLHIGLIAAWLYILARWLALRLWPRGPVLSVAAATALTGALAYALLAGLALPTQRALVMVAAGLFAVVVMRRVAASRMLALAALAVLLWSPASVIAPGFWLSFGAVAWLIYLSRWTRRRRFAGFVLLQLGLVAGLAPLTLGWFGQASLVAPLVNALLIPAAAFVVPALLIAVLLALVWPPAGAPILKGVAAGMNAAWPVLEAVAHWPWAAIQPAASGALALVLAMLGVGLVLLPAGLPGRWLAPVLMLPALLGWRPDIDAIAPGGYRLSVLDVGQGLAIVVRTRGHTLVYDAGPAYRTGFDAGQAFVVPYLRHIGRTRIDRMIISHGDIDHVGGAQAIEAALDVGERIGAGGSRACRAGESWRWDGVRFSFVYPRAGDLGANTASNAHSCVLRIDGPGGAALLPGDIEADTESALVARDRAALDSDILVVAHHGSASSSSAEFLGAASPRFALISAGWHNRWGFPDAAVVRRLEDSGARIENTATAGALAVHVPPGSQAIRIEAWRQRRPRVWHLP
jgi:competence protein ComEC